MASAHKVTDRSAAQTNRLTPYTGPMMRVPMISTSITTAPLTETVMDVSQRVRGCGSAWSDGTDGMGNGYHHAGDPNQVTPQGR